MSHQCTSIIYRHIPSLEVDVDKVRKIHTFDLVFKITFPIGICINYYKLLSCFNGLRNKKV